MNIRILIASVIFFFCTQTSADVIQISVSKQSPEMQSIERPAKGLNKEDVEGQFGSPEAIDDPIGEPPISKWHYGEYIVYFEHDIVIHTVLNHRPIETP